MLRTKSLIDIDIDHDIDFDDQFSLKSATSSKYFQLSVFVVSSEELMKI